MGIFTGISKAVPTGGGCYLLDGNYLLEVIECKSGETRDGLPYFVADCLILESTNPERPKGLKVSWWIGLRKDSPALANVRKFIATASDVPLEEVDDAGAEMVVSVEQPLKGTVMRAAAVTINKKRSQGVFTKVDWELYEGTPEKVAELKKAARLG